MKTSPVCVALSCAALALLVGCASRPKSEKNYDAAYIDYALPFTSVQLNARMVLTECGDNPTVESEITLAPVASASPYPEHRLRIKGSDLASFSKKRELAIELHPHDAIKSINASVEDRSGAILVNILKIAGALAAAPDRGDTNGACNKKTVSALKRSADLKREISELRENLEKNPAKTMKQIDALAAEVGRITSGQLTLNLSKLIVIDQEQTGGVIVWSKEDLEKWFDLADTAKPANFKLAWCLHDWVPNFTPTCTGVIAQSQQDAYAAAKAKKAKAGGSWAEKPSCPGDDCSVSIVFRDPKAVEIVVASSTGDVKGGSSNALGRLKFPLSQGGEYTYFPLKVGFGGSKSLTLALDEFGRRTSFGWKSGARGEGIIGGVQSIAEAASAWQTSKAGADIKQDKATIEELETKKKLNELEACRATIEAGGFTCTGQ